MTADVSVASAIRAAAQRLVAAGIPDAGQDARILAAATTGLTREQILRDPDTPLCDASVGRLRVATARRAAREPVSRIVGYREFMGLSFGLDPTVLDPRPDSETLVEAVLALVRPGPLRILDMGTGTGCLLLSILDSARSSWGVGSDISEGACRTAAANAVRLRLNDRAHFVAGTWAEALSGEFDVVVCNPPYIPSAEINRLAPEVRDFDPRAALDGGPDGLDGYRRAVTSVVPRLATEGILAVETGPGQSGAVTGIFASAGMKIMETRTDLAGRIRALVFMNG